MPNEDRIYTKLPIDERLVFTEKPGRLGVLWKRLGELEVSAAKKLVGYSLGTYLPTPDGGAYFICTRLAKMVLCFAMIDKSGGLCGAVTRFDHDLALEVFDEADLEFKIHDLTEAVSEFAILWSANVKTMAVASTHL